MKKTTGILVLLLTLFAGTAVAQSIYPGDAVRINGETISYQRFQSFYVEYRDSKGVAIGARGDQLDLLKQLRREAMDLLIEQVLVAQQAEKAGVRADEATVDEVFGEVRSVFDDEATFEMKLKEDGFTQESLRRHLGRMMAAQQYLDGIRENSGEVTEQDLKRYYEDNAQRLTLPEQVRVRHILITWKPMGKQDDRAFIRESMQPILERARAGEDFAALAREFSDDFATKQMGGDTGFFHRGQMAPAFEEAAFALEPGEVSDVVETSFGVHIIKLEQRQERELLAYDDIHDQLRDHVRQEKAEAAVRAEIDRLQAAADIEILVPVPPAQD